MYVVIKNNKQTLEAWLRIAQSSRIFTSSLTLMRTTWYVVVGSSKKIFYFIKTNLLLPATTFILFQAMGGI